jgi:hypothetical protein
MPFTPGPPIDEGPGPAPGGLGERIVNGASHLGARIYNAIREPFGRAIDNTVHRWVEEAEDYLNGQMERAIGKIEAARGANSVSEAVRIMLDPWFLVALVPALVGFVGGVLSSTARYAVQFWLHRAIKQGEFEANRAFPAARLSTAEGVAAAQRDSFTLGQLAEDLRDLGWSDDRITAMVNAAYRWPTIDQIIELYNRGEIDAGRFMYLLRGSGLKDEDAISLSALAERLAPATDLIRFAVREAFDPAFEGEQMSNYPGALYEQYMAYLGFPAEIARLYWRAHWDLPSISQGYTFYHRFGDHRPDGGAFTEGDLRELLRIQDLLPRYHDVAIRAAFNPVTRIDLRRLYTSRVYTRDQVYLGYLDLGYNPENAEALTEFTTRTSSTADRELTKSEVLNAYKRRLLDRAEASGALQDFGYDPQLADLLLAGADYDLAQTRAARRTTVLRARFLAGLLSPAAAVTQLADLGKPPEEIDELITLWGEQLAERVERPTPSQVLGFYRDRVISGPDAAAELRLAGYDDRYVEWYIRQADAAIAEEEARKSDAEARASIVRLPIPTRGDLTNWLRRGIITAEEFAARLLAQGYTAADVSAYAASVRLPIAIPYQGSPEGRIRTLEVKLAFERDTIDAAELRRRLSGLGYPAELADAIADYAELKVSA